MTTHGQRRDGDPITDADVEAMADEAEAGYDVDDILTRRKHRGGRRTIGSSAASVESVRLDPELRAALLRQAATEGISVSEAIRRALRSYTNKAS